jgi:anti-sigma B factor antagonist
MDSQLNQKKKALLRLCHSLSIYETNELKNSLTSSLEENDILELDIRDINECDTAGLQLLCSAKKTAARTGKILIITGESTAVEDAMDRAGMTLEMIIQK